MSTGSGARAVVAALAANVGIAVTKFLAFLLTGSSSMLAEATHSLADSGNQLLLLVGARRSRRAASVAHPFGYGRERYIYAFIVSVVLFTVGGLFAGYEGIHKIREPEPIDQWRWVPLTVVAVAIVLEAFSMRTAVGEANPARGRSSWREFVRHARAPELPVVLLEDAAALIGLALAAVGIGLTLITGDGRWDGVATVAIGLLLVLVAAILAIETKSLLIGEAATAEVIAAIETALVATPGVLRIIHLKTLHLGPEEVLVAAKIAVGVEDRAQAVAATIDAAEVRIRAAAPTARVIYLEPDIDLREP